MVAELRLEIGSEAESLEPSRMSVCRHGLSEHRASLPFVPTELKGPLLRSLVVQWLISHFACSLRMTPQRCAWRGGLGLHCTAAGTARISPDPRAACEPTLELSMG